MITSLTIYRPGRQAGRQARTHMTPTVLKLIYHEATGNVSLSESHNKGKLNMTGLTVNKQRRGSPNSLLQ